MKRIFILYHILLQVILLPAVAIAGVSVNLMLDRKEATLSDTVKLAIRISGTGNSGVEPTIKGLEAFTRAAH